MKATFIKPMLCHTWVEPGWPTEGWIAEPKLDGQRAQVHVERHRTVAVYSRLGNDWVGDVGMEWLRQVKWKTAAMVLDAELFVGGGNGEGAKARAHDAVAGARAIACFDVLQIDGGSVMDETWAARRAQLVIALRGQKNPQVQLTVTVPSAKAEALWREWTRAGGEGVLMKRPESRYRPGARSQDWLKRKVWFTVDVVVTGVTSKPTYGAKAYAGGRWACEYGFWSDAEQRVVPSGQGLRVDRKEVVQGYVGQIAEVKVCAVMDTGGLRHAQFIRWRDDKRAEECVRP